MQYQQNPQVIETDDLDKLRDMHLQTVQGEQQIVLTFSIRSHKQYGANEAPTMVFLTNGVEPRMLLAELQPLPAPVVEPAPVEESAEEVPAEQETEPAPAEEVAPEVPDTDAPTEVPATPEPDAPAESVEVPAEPTTATEEEAATEVPSAIPAPVAA